MAILSHIPRTPRAVPPELTDITVRELLERIQLARSIVSQRAVIDETARTSIQMALAGVDIVDIVDFERWSNGDYPEPDALTLGA